MTSHGYGEQPDRPDPLADFINRAKGEALGIKADPLELKVDAALALIREEVLNAARKHPKMHSAHEGYAILKEEVDELWDEVKADRAYQQSGMKEVLQVGAMSVRFLVDLYEWHFHHD